jgi:hypothetical protein
MQKVPKRNKNITIPYEPEYYETPESSPEIMAEKDYETVAALGKNPDKTKLRDFINKRLTQSENISDTPGLSTRDYMEAITGEAVKRRYPEIRKAALEGTTADLGKAVRSKMFPDISKALKASKLSEDIESSDDKNDVDLETGLMRLSGGQTPSGDVGTTIHETSHLLDALARKYSRAKYLAKIEGRPVDPNLEKSVKEFLKSKPAAASLFEENPSDYDKKFEKYITKKESKNKYGETIKNPEIPNFGDYDFGKGEFQSDMIRDPLDVQKESGERHFLDTNRQYENMIKALEDDGKLDRLTKQNRFTKLRSLIS